MPVQMNPAGSSDSGYASSSHRNAKRRRVQDSSIAGSDISIQSSSSGGSYTAERYRVGIPALKLLPLRSKGNPPMLAVGKMRELQPQIERILENRSIEFDEDDIELTYRTFPDEDPTDDDLTLLIVAEWKNDIDGQTWYMVADEIRSLLVSSAATRSIKVEILSLKIIAKRMLDIVETGHPAVDAWETINPLILSIISDYPRLEEGWRSIDLLRIGFVSEESMPMPVTVSITVDWSLVRKDWYQAEQRLKQLLQDHNLDEVDVDIARGDMDPTVFPLEKPSRQAKSEHEYYKGDYPVRMPMGAEFGPAQHFTEGPNGPHINGPNGTIGGYLEVRRAGGPWIRYAVTNYHCMRPVMPGWWYKAGKDGGNPEEGEVPPTSLLRKIDLKGMGARRLATEKDILNLECPSRRNHEFTVAFHENRMATIPGPTLPAVNEQARQSILEHQASRAAKIQFFDRGKQHFGRVWLCSGLTNRTRQNGRIDVALIEVEADRMGGNMIPGKEAWSHGSEAPLGAYSVPLTGIALFDLEGGFGPVYKIGARTGATTGRYSKVRHNVKLAWDKDLGMKDKTSREYCFVPTPGTDGPDRAFQDHGDSGAFVFTDDARWVGQSFAGSSKPNMQGQTLAYVTAAQDIIEYITGLEDGKTYEVRLPEA